MKLDRVDGGDSLHPGEGAEGEEEEGVDVDHDESFLSHSLRFAKDDGEETRKAEREYEVIDPRARGAKAKEEERQRKAREKEKSGRRYGGRR